MFPLFVKSVRYCASKVLKFPYLKNGNTDAYDAAFGIEDDLGKKTPYSPRRDLRNLTCCGRSKIYFWIFSISNSIQAKALFNLLCWEFLWCLFRFLFLFFFSNSRFVQVWLCSTYGFIPEFLWFLFGFSNLFPNSRFVLNFGFVRLLGLFKIFLVFVWFFEFVFEFLLCRNCGSVRILGLFRIFWCLVFRLCLVFFELFFVSF